MQSLSFFGLEPHNNSWAMLAFGYCDFRSNMVGSK